MVNGTAKRVGGLALGAVVVTLVMTGCTSVQRAGSAPTGPGTPAVTTTEGAESPAAEDGVGGGETAVAKPAAENRGGDTSTRTTTRTSTHTSARKTPKVESLVVVRKPECAITGTPDAPFSRPGKDRVRGGKVSGADGAALSVDNPGTYGGYGSDYPAEEQLELAFPCDPGTAKTSHTYTVWPAGAESGSRTITVSAAGSTP